MKNKISTTLAVTLITVLSCTSFAVQPRIMRCDLGLHTADQLANLSDRSNSKVALDLEISGERNATKIKVGSVDTVLEVNKMEQNLDVYELIFYTDSADSAELLDFSNQESIKLIGAGVKKSPFGSSEVIYATTSAWSGVFSPSKKLISALNKYKNAIKLNFKTVDSLVSDNDTIEKLKSPMIPAKLNSEKNSELIKTLLNQGLLQSSDVIGLSLSDYCKLRE